MILFIVLGKTKKGVDDMKVLILTARYGMGHISASESIKQDIIKYNTSAEVEVVDFFEYSVPHLAELLYSSFNMIIKYAKPMYSRNYVQNDREDMRRDDILTKTFSNSLKKLVKNYNPDVIISTFPVISKAVSFYKYTNKSSIPLITCITDVSSHYEWIHPGTDGYLVPCYTIKEELESKGVSPEIVSVYGIPVSDKFKRSFNDQMKERRSAFRDTRSSRKKELLIMGGGLGMLPSSPSFFESVNSLKNIHTTIVTGNNKKLYDMIHGKYRNITVLGYANNVDELMRKADCVMTKPGGITVFEAIHSLTPIISFKTTLPNEVKNVEFIEDNIFGITLYDSVSRSVSRIESFLNNNDRIEKMKSSMVSFVNRLDDTYFVDFEYRVEAMKGRYDESVLDRLLSFN